MRRWKTLRDSLEAVALCFHFPSDFFILFSLTEFKKRRVLCLNAHICIHQLAKKHVSERELFPSPASERSRPQNGIIKKYLGSRFDVVFVTPFSERTDRICLSQNQLIYSELVEVHLSGSCSTAITGDGSLEDYGQHFLSRRTRQSSLIYN